MNIAVHIPFYYIENRLQYLRKVLDDLATIPHSLDVFVYSNQRFQLTCVYTHMHVYIIYHMFLKLPMRRAVYDILPWAIREHLDPHLLTWIPRQYIPDMLEKYEVQMYMEDDIGFTNEAFQYWLNYKDMCLPRGYNLGFLRVETDRTTNRWFCTDLLKAPCKVVYIEKQPFVYSEGSYCASWLYDRTELRHFTQSEEWRFKSGVSAVRERAALGWHGEDMPRYRGTVMPLIRVDAYTYVVNRDCKVHHLPNNYIGHHMFCSVVFPIHGRIVASKQPSNDTDVFVVDGEGIRTSDFTR